MKATVRKEFDYSSDGLTLRRLRVGEEHDISASLFNGLRDAGLIEPIKEIVDAQPVAAPRIESAPRHNKRFDDRRR